MFMFQGGVPYPVGSSGNNLFSALYIIKSCCIAKPIAGEFRERLFHLAAAWRIMVDKTTFIILEAPLYGYHDSSVTC